MSKSRTVAAMLLFAALAAPAPPVMAQEGAGSLEGIDWRLTRVGAAGGLEDVPGDLEPSLLLAAGAASGEAGCNRFLGSYMVDGSSISFGDGVASTSMACVGDAQAVEDAYLAALPQVAAWTITDGILTLSDADQAPLLVYGASAAPAPATDIDLVLDELLRLQAVVTGMDGRLTALEGDGSGGSSAPAERPAKPQIRGGKVKTVVPDWMRDEFRPESERSANKDREVIRWRKVANNATGIRVYARRGYCALKANADTSQQLEDSDFRRRTGQAQLVAELDADALRYRPSHEAIDALLPAAPESPYSNDQFYDVLVAAYNAAGESKRALAGSYYLTPEFNCP